MCGTQPTGELQRRAIGPLSIGSHEVRPRPGDDNLVAEEFDVKVHGETLANNRKGCLRRSRHPFFSPVVDLLRLGVVARDILTFRPFNLLRVVLGF